MQIAAAGGRRPRLVALLWLVALLAGVAHAGRFGAGEASAAGPPGPLAASFVAGEVLVRFREDVSGASAEAVAREHDATIRQRHRGRVLRLRVPAGSEEEIVRRLARRPEVEFAEPNYVAYAVDTIPNDAYYGGQWNLPVIQTPAAWDITTGASSVTVAVIDSGIDLDHPDLDGKVASAKTFISTGAYDPGGWCTPVAEGQDDFGHGSHVGGIVGAETNNAQGVAGVSWGVRLMSLKVLDCTGRGSYADLSDAIYHAADNGAEVINLSLEGTASSATLDAAVDHARNTRGVLVVAAAGNSAQNGNPTVYPCASPGVLCVAATTSSDVRAGYSEYGSFVDLAAPGGDDSAAVLSTVWNDAYGYRYGTSMAAPHVAGAAALVRSVNPNLSVGGVERVLLATAEDKGDPGWDQYYGYGRVDARAAVQLARDLTSNVTYLPLTTKQ